ncbi:MAG: efflux RND transporter periplasmic adaptor subunit [Proteobacteria bacterium]|nr:efflux RND transporter periplasmic adaptor subunit [Pseudomonadota bacterium]
MKKWKWALLVISVCAVIAAAVLFNKKSTKTEYREAKIQKGMITLQITSTGTVQPENRLQIKSPIAGRVDKVLVQEGDKVKKGQIIAWLSSSERAALIDAARSQGEDEVKKWEDLYKPTPLIAPIAGTIILRAVEPGQTFTTSDAVLVMSDRLTVKAQVDETDLAQIFLKQKATITLDAYSDKVVAAVVDQIAYEAKTVNNVTTYIIDVLPKETIDYMRSGMTANVIFIGKSKEDIVLIPNEFIKYENGKSVALTKVDDKKTELKELSLGITDGKNTEVLNGLADGDTVLLVIAKKDAKSSSPFSPFGAGPKKRPTGGGGGK